MKTGIRSDDSYSPQEKRRHQCFQHELRYHQFTFGKSYTEISSKILLPWCFKWNLLRLIRVSVILFELSISEFFFAKSSKMLVYIFCCFEVGRFEVLLFDTVVSYLSFLRVSNTYDWFRNHICRTVLSQDKLCQHVAQDDLGFVSVMVLHCSCL